MDELTPQQKNDTVATRIMGWNKGFYRYGEEPEFVNPYETWIDANGQATERHTRHSIYAECGSEVWNPCGDLNDCYLAEEKMSEELHKKYVVRLFGDVVESTNLETYWPCIHATPMQKVNAMLKAIQSV